MEPINNQSTLFNYSNNPIKTLTAIDEAVQEYNKQRYDITHLLIYGIGSTISLVTTTPLSLCAGVIWISLGVYTVSSNYSLKQEKAEKIHQLTSDLFKQIHNQEDFTVESKEFIDCDDFTPDELDRIQDYLPEKKIATINQFQVTSKKTYKLVASPKISFFTATSIRYNTVEIENDLGQIKAKLEAWRSLLKAVAEQKNKGQKIPDFALEALGILSAQQVSFSDRCVVSAEKETFVSVDINHQRWGMIRTQDFEKVTLKDSREFKEYFKILP